MKSRRSRLLPPTRPAGYTVVVINMAIAVLSLGATGVIAMQKATLIANVSARNLVTATDLAQSWMERMRVDSLAWNEPAGTLDLGNDTMWLKLASPSIGWLSPLANNLALQPTGSPQADVMGADIYTGDPTLTAFCAQTRLIRFADNPTFNDLYRMIRVEVRVYWDKSGRQLDCTAALPTDYTLGRYGFVYMVSAVLENNSPI